MKPVTTRHDSDCVAAALAAVFELPIEEMPDFWRASRTGADQAERVRRTGADQAERVRRWLAPRGLHWYFSTYGGTDCPRLRDFVASEEDEGTFPPRGFWLAQISSVDRLRDGDPNHVVVMKGRKCVFNPSGTVKQALEGPWFLIGYYLLVPLDPAEWT